MRTWLIIILLIIILLLASSCVLVPLSGAATQQRPPNFVVIFCDDLGYGDLGSFGHPTIRTPHLDRMAVEGQKWTSFYVGDSVCTPSRTALLTGRYPLRSGMAANSATNRRVLFPNSAGGLPANELTLAEVLKPKGYATACVGKWHLGHLPQYLPTQHGFDSYFGIPYSNDMDAVATGLPGEEGRRRMMNPKIEYWNVPLLRNDQLVERPAEQATLTKRYTDEAIKFIEANRQKPFFLYLAHTMPHMPLFRSPEFAGRSQRGLYGDVIEELDANVGRVLATLRRLQLDRNTIVVFTSDNGPWLVYNEQGGSAGLLRGGKGGTFEGGQRVPTIFWGPGIVKPGIVSEMGATMDLLPTFSKLAGATLPKDLLLDGYDLTPVLRATGRSPRNVMFYYRAGKIYAVRAGSFKAHFYTKSEYGRDEEAAHEPVLLYNLDHDPSEKHDIARQHPEVIAEIRQIVEEHSKTMRPVENQLEKVIK